MTNSDLGPFLDTFRELRGVLVHRRLEEKEETQQETAYFRALQRYPFRDIRLAADQLLRSTAKFPAPADWIAALPKGSRHDLRQLRASEGAEFRRADSMEWEDEPCDCVACEAAGVTHRRVRYVPTVDADGEVEQAVNNAGQAVTLGHWAHGPELARWYATHAQYLADLQAFRASGGPRSMPALSDAVRATCREPGEEG